MTARQLPNLDYLALKAATRALVKACGGGNAAAAVTRVRQQELSDYGNPAEGLAERFMPLDVVADLEAECGLALVSGQLAALSGLMLVRKPVAGAAASDVAALCRVTKESADVASAYADALADGQVTREEARAVIAEILEAQRAFAALEALLAPVAEAG